ncbi:hypothetical protein MTP99_007762 [Tenebrio molitor]|nr:hypothetical protein MTP99_007762 [Tenebrio molitor]CAH1366422.1 unnamed protein product [Tenebrio molitor]
MSAAMRSTLQTVPESLEVTKNADPASSAKTPVKVSSDANKSSRSYNYHTPSSTNKETNFNNLFTNGSYC